MGGHLRLPKSELRRLLQTAQARREPAEVAVASCAVCGWIARLTIFRRAAHLVAYVAHRGEIDPAPVVDRALADGKAVYFPRVVGTGIEFLESTPQELTPGAYGIREPRHGRPLDRSISDVLLLVPALAFDATGIRLGRGGGHYDRALAMYPNGLRVGPAAESQLSPGLPRDDWDQPIDVVVTERRLLWSTARAGHHPGTGIKENLT